ncbi:CoA transferase [Kitasatospora nipponensis]|uniref:CoA transferase n=1 Tax=Kitasatospora nipponensis TaxID=258049 RepID=A0ABN1WVW0_9ACTN
MTDHAAPHHAAPHQDGSHHAAPHHDGPDPDTAHAWSALGGADEPAAGIRYRPAPGTLPARLPVRRLARACVGVCSLAAAVLLAAGGGASSAPDVLVDEDAVAAAFVSELRLRIDGRTPTVFAPLSGFWRTADGWLRTHANYPHHRARLLAALDLPATGTDPGRLARELAGRSAVEVQEAVYAAGGLAVAVAPPAPAAGHAARHPLVELTRPVAGAGRALAPAALPAAGVRVLDLTRVIAGPVATRTLALLGADVLRIDSPRLPESPEAHADTGFGKRSACLDLALPADRAVLEELLGTADVVVTGYRPAALDAFGLGAGDLLRRHPGLVVAQLCAWGWSGEWAGRRGFDSLVQAARGIAVLEAGPDGAPGVLPAQALDHGTGYLLAAGVLRALTERQADGRGAHLRFSLAGTADWLLGMASRRGGSGDSGDFGGSGPEATAGPASERLGETGSPYGQLRYARPPLGYRGAPTDWASGPGRWGTDRPSWR